MSQCTGLTQTGHRCSKVTSSLSKRCHLHSARTNEGDDGELPHASPSFTRLAVSVDMKMEELRAVAQLHSMNIRGARSKQTIVNAIHDHVEDAVSELIKDMTIPQLRRYAETRSIPLTITTRATRADIRNTIVGASHSQPVLGHPIR
jgi:hypothetical protein